MSNDLINHKPWCAPTRCSRDLDHVPPRFAEHRSAPAAVLTDDADISTARVELIALDGQQASVDFDLIRLVVNMTVAESSAETFLDAEQARQLAARLVELADSIDRDGAK